MLELNLPVILPLSCVTHIGYFEELIMISSIFFGGVAILLLVGCVASRVCAALDASEWDQDADGEIDREEFMSAQPQGKFIADLCGNLWFYIYLFLYTSTTRAFFSYFACDVSALPHLTNPVKCNCPPRLLLLLPPRPAL